MKIFSILLNTVFVILVAIAGLLVLSTFSIFGLRTFTVQSGSMEPAIGTGSLIFTQSAQSYEVGDIVTRKIEEQMTVTHRIVDVEDRDGERIFETQGDANDAPDGEDVRQDEIVGKVLFHIPYLGYPVSYAQTPQGFLILIVIPSVIIVYEELGKMRRETARLWKKRKDKGKRETDDSDSSGVEEKESNEEKKMDL